MIAFILVLLLFYISYPIKSNAYSNIYNSAEEKVFSNVSINDDFEKDCIMVVMKKDVSAINKEYHVTSGTVPGQQYATCLLCGGLARLGLVGPMSLNTYPHTINGSYILPNGVIVLADDDIDAYFAGTLVFIYPNDDLLNNYRTYPFLVRKKEQFVFNGGNER